MSAPITSHPRSRPTIITPSTFTQDISRAILASSQMPKSVDAEPHPHLGLQFPPPPPPPSPVESRNPHALWGSIDGKHTA
jgi:hypothetical protein